MKKIIITVLTTVTAMVVAAFMGLYMLLGGSLENVAQTVRLISTMSFVKSQYVDDVPLVQLVDGAIDGMVKSLGDKHSIYMDDENFKAFMQQTEGSFGGVGIVMGFPKDGTCQVMSVIEDTPSAQAGIQPKDEIIKIDGADVSNMQPDEMAAKVRGDEGTQVVLTVRRQGQENFDVTLTRAIIPLTTAKGTIIDGTNKDKIAGPPKCFKIGIFPPIVPSNQPIVKITAKPPNILTGSCSNRAVTRIMLAVTR